MASLRARGVAAGAARAAPAPAAPAQGGALRISAEPGQLLLGRDGVAELRIAAGAEVEDVSVTASVGKVEGLRRLPGGGYAARYRAPAERVPQVAIVAAVGHLRGAAVDGWIAIPLYGQGDARVRARPGTPVVLRIGDALFGPRTAGPDGVAAIPVVVPPGVREAHHGFAPVDLKVPETPLLHAVIDRAAIRADRPETLNVIAYVIAPHGVARRGDEPAFEPSRGTVAFAAREAGAYEGTWVVPPGPAGEVRLAVRLPGAGASRAVLRLDAVAGPPATVAVGFDRDEVVAGQRERVRVTARALDAAGNATQGEVLLEADAGALDRPEPVGPGAVATRLVAPERLEGRRVILVTARVPAAGISGTRALALAPAAPAVLHVTPASASVVADGSREALLRVEAFDAYGNPIDGPPAVGASAGRIAGVERAPDGGWQVRYVAPRLRERGEDRIVAAAGEASGAASLRLVPAPPPVSFAACGGVMVDLSGGEAGTRLGFTADVPAPDGALPASLALGFRLDAEGLALERSTGGREVAVRALGGLAGAVLRWTPDRGPDLAVAGAVGLLGVHATPRGEGARAGFAPAARLALTATGTSWPLAPFLEFSLLAAGRSPGGAFAAAAVSAGLTLDPGGNPWRRSSSSTTSR